MSGPTLELGGCVLALVSGSVQLHESGWEEQLDLELHDGPGCTSIRFGLPDGVVFERLQGRVRGADAPNYKLDAARFQHEVGIDGTRSVLVHLPELEPGDVATLSFQRVWTRPGDYQWHPHGAGHAELKLPRGLLPEHAGLKQDGRFFWASEPGPEATLRLPHPWVDRSPPTVPFLEERGLSSDAAKARLDALTWLTRAWDGDQAVIGAPALARGAVDDRGYARTLAALCVDGPEEVLIGRWTPAEGVEPLPGAPEAAVRWADAEILLHPAHALPAGVLVTERGSLPVQAQEAAAVEAPAPGVHTALTVAIPAGDPLRRLHPGGGALLDVAQTLSWDETSRGRAIWLPLPAGASAYATVDAPGSVRITPDAMWILVPPGQAEVRVGWTVPLQDVWGELPATDSLSLAVGRTTGPFAPGEAAAAITPAGELLTDDDGTWRLARIGDLPLLTDRDRLARELRARRIGASYPEPGMPLGLRGAFRGWDLFEVLAPSLFERATPWPLPTPSTWPRPLQAARRSRVLTENEFTAVVAAYTQQARMRAEVVPVHPVGPAAAPLITPRGFDHALLWVEHDGEERWADVACAMCDTWEIRPELVGAPAIGTPATPGVALVDGLPEGIRRADGGLEVDPRPPSGVGAVQVVQESDQIRWTLTGAAALQLRRDLDAAPADERDDWLRTAYGALPTSMVGLDQRGAPVTFETPAGTAPPIDLTTLLPAASGARWAPHLGLWSWEQPDARADTAWSCAGEGWSWSTHRAAGRARHQLLVTERRIDFETPDALPTCLQAISGEVLAGSTETIAP
jgi:hypothetical protein